MSPKERRASLKSRRISLGTCAARMCAIYLVGQSSRTDSNFVPRASARTEKTSTREDQDGTRTSQRNSNPACCVQTPKTTNSVNRKEDRVVRWPTTRVRRMLDDARKKRTRMKQKSKTLKSTRRSNYARQRERESEMEMPVLN